jgi:hypothetical protein
MQNARCSKDHFAFVIMHSALGISHFDSDPPFALSQMLD